MTHALSVVQLLCFRFVIVLCKAASNKLRVYSAGRAKFETAVDCATAIAFFTKRDLPVAVIP